MNTPDASATHSPRIQWYRSPLGEPRLAELMQSSDARGLALAAGHLALLTATGGACVWTLSQGHLLVATILLWVHGACYSFLGFAGAAHELAHRNVFRTRMLNELFLYLFCFLTWNNPVYFRASHARHHRGTLHAVLDGEVRAPVRVDTAAWIWELTLDLPALRRALRIVIDNSRGIIRGDWGARLFPPGEEQARRRLIAWARVMLGGHALLAAAFLATGHWPLLLLVSLAPFIADWLNKTLALAQHAGMQSEVNDFRLNSRSVALNPLLGFLYWQMHYHVEHHMYPGVPCYHLKALRQEIHGDLPHACKGMRGVLRELLAERHAGVAAERPARVVR